MSYVVTIQILNDLNNKGRVKFQTDDIPHVTKIYITRNFSTSTSVFPLPEIHKNEKHKYRDTFWAKILKIMFSFKSISLVCLKSGILLLNANILANFLAH
jgi:hypothetical protein